MKIFKIFSTLFVFIFFFNPIAFYGQTICTNYTVTPGTTISHIGTNTYNTTINVPDSYVLTDVNVTVNIPHTWNADLDIYLISPLGTTVELSTDNGGNGDNYNNVTFDDASGNILPTGNTTLSGFYRPEGSLASFNGQNSNGNWVLRVIDDAGGDGGTIISITLNLCYFVPPPAGHLGPGGVGNATNNMLWLKGDGGAYTNAGITQATNGQPIRQWNDASGNNRHATQATLGNRPLFEAAADNGMPALRFTGDTFIDGPALGIAGTNSYTYIMAFRDTATGTGLMTDGAGHYLLDRTTATNELVSLKPVTGNFYGYQKRNNAGGGLGGPLTTTAINTNGKILEMRRDYNVNYQLFYNNNLESTSADADGATTPPNPRIGRHATTSNGGLRGFINEFIIYNFALNTAQTIIVNNYLSAKYGLALAANDIYNQDTPGNGNFDYNVAGIGQASDGTNHFDSRGSGIVRISNPSITGNNRFIFWGEETRNPVYSFTTNTANYTEQLNSRWRVARQGNLGNVTVSFDISSMNLTGKPGCSPLQLVVDNNYDFSSPTNVYDLTIVGTTATATGVDLQNNRYFTLRYTDQIVWDGTNFYNGAGAGNAPNNTNACLKFTVKANGAININAYVREVEIEAGATLNVANGTLLRVENQVAINGNINLLGEAQLIQNHTGTSLNSGTGSLTARQQGTTNAFNYNYWSSPVSRAGNWQIGYLEDAAGPLNFTTAANPNPATSPITLSSRWLYSFKGPSGNYNSWTKLTPTTNLSPGTGYSMKGSGRVAPQEEYIFRGIPNDGTYNISVTAGTDFLTGNPYPSTLDANLFITNNLPVIDGSLYFWESFTTNNSHYLENYEGGYAIYNLMMPLPAVADFSGLTSGGGTAIKPAPTQYINVGQGFFTTITNTGTLTFNNAQRAFARESLGQTIYYKTVNDKETATDERSKIWFSFTTPKGQVKIIGLGYDNQATSGYDKGYDAKSYDNLNNDFYWLSNDDTLVIQALPNIDIEDDLPLELKISDAGLYKFSIDKMENVPSDLTIYLFDKNQNIYYNLKDAEAELLLNSGIFDEFSIVFKAEQSLGITPVEDNKIFVSYDSNTKILELHTKQALANIDSFQIYNILGQAILNIKAPESKSINVSNLPNGIYFLKVNTKYNENSKSIKFAKH
ncbi:proprotein convertase P-domain-containing protein [Confluentibacter lentus]|uniref:proprotein convertase P-domain-containing protein n=1 Tax=Confluentibacter lentus TaxID=1699412 RepID=UPI000C28142D|nr:proprotein convertase P-domain-containing protein [Confluentibacter lentus]